MVPVLMLASTGVTLRPFPPLMQLITSAVRSLTLLTLNSISMVLPVIPASVLKSSQPMTAFAPFVSSSESPVQPLLFQSKPSNDVLMPFESHLAGLLSPLLRPDGLSFTDSP